MAENFRDWIRRKRGELKLTQADFATALGVSQTTISQWESGRNMPTLGNLSAIAKLDVPGHLEAQADADLPGTDGVSSAGRRAHLEASLERARELYIDGDLTRAQYETRRHELQAALSEVAAPTGEQAANLDAVRLWLGDVDHATPVELQAVAAAFYARLAISGETRCAFIDYQARDWCAAWA